MLNICHIIIVHVDYPLYRAHEAKPSILIFVIALETQRASDSAHITSGSQHELSVGDVANCSTKHCNIRIDFFYFVWGVSGQNR
jgi:hypothetical protein